MIYLIINGGCVRDSALEPLVERTSKIYAPVVEICTLRTSKICAISGVLLKF
jgi:hypothetical protein